MKVYFDHKKIDVYHEAINFCGWVGQFWSSIPAEATAQQDYEQEHEN